MPVRLSLLSRRRERGAVAIVLALLLPFILGLSGLAVDIGRMVVVRAELQSAVDACALAAAAVLPNGKGDAATLRRAEAHALVPGNASAISVSGAARPPLSVNRFDFQSQTLGTAGLRVQFAESANGPWLTAGEASVGPPKTFSHARCTAGPRSVPLFLARFIGAWSTMPASATAVATLVPGQITCAFPVALCRTSGTTATSTPPFGLTVGHWFEEPSSSGTGRYKTSGNFGWVDFSPPNGGADELAKSLLGQGACALGTGGVVGESGMKSSVYDAWNSRFGLYRSGGPTPTEGPGDFSGFSFTSQSWPAKANAFSGAVSGGSNNFLSQRAAFSPYQGNKDSGGTLNMTPTGVLRSVARRGAIGESSSFQ